MEVEIDSNPFARTSTSLVAQTRQNGRVSQNQLNKQLGQFKFPFSSNDDTSSISGYSVPQRSTYSLGGTSSLRRRSRQGPGKLLLYFHANAEDLGKTFYLLNLFRRRLNVRVLAMDFPGYGLYGYEEKGSDMMLKSALLVYDFAN